MKMIISMSKEEKEAMSKLIEVSGANANLDKYKFASFIYTECGCNVDNSEGFEVDMKSSESFTIRVIEWMIDSMESIKKLAECIISGYKTLAHLCGVPKFIIDGEEIIIKKE